MRRKKKKKIILIILLGILFLLAATAVTGGVLKYRFDQNVLPVYTVEAGEAYPSAEDFEKTPWDGSEIDQKEPSTDMMTPGVHTVTISWGPFSKDVELIIQDTSAPKGETRDLVREKGEKVTPEDFLVSAQDTTKVTAYFHQTPDLNTEGESTVKIYLEDQGGNRTLLTATLTVYDPENVPKIEGTQSRHLYTGENVAYRTGVTVDDPLDPAAKLTIDSSRVDLDTPGVYTVTYKAEDKYGRVGTADVQVYVNERPENYDDMIRLKELTKQRAAELTTPGMTDIEKAFAVFRYVRKTIPWNNTRTNRDEIEQALAGMEGKAGDCYTHAITCKTLLDEVGIENIFMERNPGPGQHYWLMVRIQGEWYHMDPSPIYMHKLVCFLGTDDEARWFSEEVRPGFYNYDHSLFPTTPLESPARVSYKGGEYTLEILQETAQTE